MHGKYLQNQKTIISPYILSKSWGKTYGTRLVIQWSPAARVVLLAYLATKSWDDNRGNF